MEGSPEKHSRNVQLISWRIQTQYPLYPKNGVGKRLEVDGNPKIGFARHLLKNVNFETLFGFYWEFRDNGKQFRMFSQLIQHRSDCPQMPQNRPIPQNMNNVTAPSENNVVIRRFALTKIAI